MAQGKYKSAVQSVKRIIRRVYPVKISYPEWDRFLKDGSSLDDLSIEGRSRPRILFANVGGHVLSTTLESLLALASKLRGAEVEIILCDEALPACERVGIDVIASERGYAHYGPRKDACGTCFAPAYEMFKSLGIPVRRYGDFLTADDYQAIKEVAAAVPVDEIPFYTDSSIPIGEHALAGALRFFARGDLTGERYGETILRRYLQAALVTATAFSRLLDLNDYDCVVAHHGIYIPQGIVSAIARSKDVRVVNWTKAYRRNRFTFSHTDTYHHTMMSEPVSNWEDMTWNDQIEEELLDYLKSRWDGSRDWVSFNRAPENDLETIKNELGVDFSKPCVGLLTNVIWDAQLHYPSNIFPNMIDWLLTTLRYFAARPDLQLIVRIHPAEVTGYIKSRQPALEEIRRAFPKLPDNIFIIPPTSSFSTYATMLQCNSVIIYGTKTGVELTSMGIPVIVAGEAWIRNKGITIDPVSVPEYISSLDALPFQARLDDEQMRRARKYAYHFFFRRMIPLEYIEDTEATSYQVKIQSLDELRPGNSLGLDVICDGIMHGAEFIYPSESLNSRDAVLASVHSEAAVI